MKKESFQYVRALAIIAVVIIHSVYMGILEFGSQASIAQGIAFRIIMNMMYWAVPCFLITTGALLLGSQKNHDIKYIFRKYILRMVIVLFLFGTVYNLMELIYDAHMTFKIEYLGTALLGVIQGQSWAHMWYLYCIIGIYLLLPLWKVFSDNASDEVIKYVLIVMFVIHSVAELTQLFGITFGFYDHIRTIYPFWILMGVAYNRGILNRFDKIKWPVFIIVSLLICSFTVLNELYGNKTIQGILFNYDSVLIVLQASSLYLIISRIQPKQVLKKVLLTIDEKSFGIYVIHMVSVNFIYKFLKINPFGMHGTYLALVIISAFAVSFILAAIMRKMPLLKRII